jgi:hypothetical protein
MKRMRYQPWVGLPNILCRDFVVPELMQDDCTPQALADAARLAGPPPPANGCSAASTELHHLLRRDTARVPPMPSRKSFLPEQLGPAGRQPGLVAGVDEAGRGPLAGPVVAAAVILDDLQPIRAWPTPRR